MPPVAPKTNIPYVMPMPPAIVAWRQCKGGETNYAIVTRYNKNSVCLMVFPTESRVGVPKEGVRFIADPWNDVHGVSPDSGVWEFTEESKILMSLYKELGSSLGKVPVEQAKLAK